MVQLLCNKKINSMPNHSRLMLEAKSALYNKLSNGEIEGITLFLSLVDVGYLVREPDYYSVNIL